MEKNPSTFLYLSLNLDISQHRFASIVAFDFVADLAKKAVTNQLNRKDVGISSGPATYVGGGTSEAVLPSGNADACQDVQDNIDTIVGIVTIGDVCN